MFCPLSSTTHDRVWSVPALLNCYHPSNDQGFACAGKKKGVDDKEEDDEAQEVVALLKRMKDAHPPPEILKVMPALVTEVLSLGVFIWGFYSCARLGPDVRAQCCLQLAPGAALQHPHHIGQALRTSSNLQLMCNLRPGGRLKVEGAVAARSWAASSQVFIA